MKKFSYVIKDEIGIHARPAGLLVKEAGKFQSVVTLKSGAKSGDAKRIFGIMGMAVKQNNEVTVEAEGADEEEAIAALKKFFEENL
jgi:phosphocarrier protein HPr